MRINRSQCTLTETIFVHLQIVDSHLQMRIDLGSDDRSLSLPHVNVSDGLWHTVHMRRWGNQAVLQLDGGDGRCVHYV